MTPQQTNDTPQIEIPSAPAAEQTYLAALVTGRLDDELLMLNADEFTQQRHQLIYEAARKRRQSPTPLPIAPALLIEDLSTGGDLVLVGGPAYLETLAEQGQSVSAPVAEECALTIRQKSVARHLQKMGQILALGSSSDLSDTLAELFKQTENCQFKLAVSRRVELTTAQALRFKLGQQKWLWPGYIPIGHVTVLISQQGQGKSNVALDLCHRLATTGEWPDGTHVGDEWEPGDRIFYLDAEGFLQGILTRLSAWGTPDDSFIWPQGCDSKQWALNTPADWQRFESIVAQYRPRLIVIDSLSGANTLEEKDNDQMKALILNMVALTQKYRLALVLVHHKRKAGVGEPSWPITLDSSRGASAITQFPRVVHAIGTPDASQPLERRFETIKNNLGEFAPPLGFRIYTEGLAWGDAPQVPVRHSESDKAEHFLIEALTPVEMRPVQELETEAKEQGISQRTLHRGKAKLDLRTIREPGTTRRFWALRRKAVPQGMVEDAA